MGWSADGFEVDCAVGMGSENDALFSLESSSDVSCASVFFEFMLLLFVFPFNDNSAFKSFDLTIKYFISSSLISSLFLFLFHGLEEPL